jgi:type I restriction enzyme S subunit
MSFPRYEAYKDSGVEWLGEVPEHWNRVPLKHVAVLNPKKSEYQGDQNQICSFLPMEKLKTGTITLDEKRTISDVYGGYTYFENGDILQAKVTPCFENKNIAIAEKLINGIGFGSSEINVLRASKSISNKFLYYRLQETNFMDFCISSMTGVAGLQRVPSDIINNFSIALPKKTEQVQIARFLDYETTRIDALIAEQERLIELLQEKRQAVISHAVTKGLDPTVPMKDSGVEWLGKVPEHWNVVALKHLVSRPIIDGPHESPQKQDTGIPFISAEAIGKGFIDFDKKWGYISKEDHQKYSQRYKPQRGDILLVKLGATTGVPAIVETDVEFNIWVPLAAIRLESRHQSRFIFHVLQSNNLRVAYELNWTYGTQQTLGLATISNLRMPLPPPNEQQEIVEYLGSFLSGLDTLESEAEPAIELLQERRSALISAAVTGKIDVRGWQAPDSKPSAPPLEATYG